MSSDLKKSLAQLEKLIERLEIEVPGKKETSSFCIKNGSYVVVSEDSMTARLCLKTPVYGEKFYSEELIMEFLTQNGVKGGIIHQAVEKVLSEFLYDTEVIVAKGTPAVKGRTGYIEYCFNLNDKICSSVTAEGTMDYSHMMKLPRVNEGDRVFTYHRAVPGLNGINVRGEQIEAELFLDTQPDIGSGVRQCIGTDEYEASIDGAVDIIDGKVEIRPVREINHDISGADGRIEFPGDIYIHGNVEAGSVIVASRNIIIDGYVSDSAINAGGTIVAVKGIIGQDKCRIVAKESVMAERIENAMIESGRNILSNSFVNSFVNSTGYVIAEGRNGAIIGGTVYALLGINAHTAGNDMGTVTVLRAGYSDEDYTRYYDFSAKEKQTLDRLSEIMDEISVIVKKMREGTLKNDDAVVKKIESLNADREECFNHLDNIRFDLRQLEEIIANGKGRSINITGEVYAGTIVEIEGQTFRIPQNTEYVKYFNEGSRIVSRVLG